MVLKQGATVEELVRALAAIGSTPRDVIAILQNLRSAGALEAEFAGGRLRKDAGRRICCAALEAMEWTLDKIRLSVHRR